MKLLLFDIDGTLLMSGGAGRAAMNRAFAHVYGFEDGFESISMMGRTDRWIVAEVLKKHELRWDEDQIRTFQQVYYQFLEQELSGPDPLKTLCPGISDLLKELSMDHTLTLGILTGNWERSARLKLRRFRIERYFKLGAYANDAEERVELLPVAMNRFQAYFGQSISPRNIFVIGDTPLDIIAARPHGVHTVGVATGHHSMESIRKENPDMLFENFLDMEKAVMFFKGQLI